MRSRFKERFDPSDAICPYCGYSYQVECEDYDEERREIDCSCCDRKFYLRQYFSVDHFSTPDCELNGEEHRWHDVTLSDGRVHPFCSECGKCKPLVPRVGPPLTPPKETP